MVLIRHEVLMQVLCHFYILLFQRIV